VRRLENVEKVLWLENNIGIDPHKCIVLEIALERLLVSTLEDISTETLGTGKVNYGRVLLRNHNLVSLGGRLHQKVRPAQQKLARVLATRHAKDDLHPVVMKEATS
jgi:hypothetical protein